ncbi:MAG: glycosyltransferase [Candidatus Micrarchaeota archaeon]|nr:glycosyltransferase [Candidatus Micrarchaeota archaeon]
MPKLRMAIATPFLENCGGMERVVLKIAKRFDAQIYCLYYDPQRTFPEFASLDVHSAGIIPRRILPFGMRLATGIEAGLYFYRLRLSGFDLVNAHTTPSEWVRNRNSPVIWYCHSPNREAFDLYEWRMKRRGPLSRLAYQASIEAFRRIEFRIVPKIEHIFANSRNTQARIRKDLGRGSEVLYPAVDARSFSFRGCEDFFFYPSRFTPEKDHAFAIEAFRIFSRTTPGFRLVLAGALPKGREAYLKRLKALASGLPVEFETDISEEELSGLYSRCTGVLYSPVSEDFGLVPLEAMASRKVCIARDDAGPRETIEHGKDGFLADSPSSMAQYMRRIVRNPQMRDRMGRAGRAKVQKRFCWENFIKAFEERAIEVVERHNRQ